MYIISLGKHRFSDLVGKCEISVEVRPSLDKLENR